MPTAGVLKQGCYSVYGLFFNSGGLLVEFNAAPFKNFNIGISYSGKGVIGEGTIKGQGLPGFNARFRIIDESLSFPAILIGASTQGKGEFLWQGKRFQTHSAGLFASASKEFKWTLGNLAIHGGMNYSFEPLPPVRFINFYGGFEQSFAKTLAVNVEINSTLDDKSMKRKGLVNAAFRWSFYPGFTLEFILRDLLSNQQNSNGFHRSFGLEFINSF